MSTYGGKMNERMTFDCAKSFAAQEFCILYSRSSATQVKQTLGGGGGVPDFWLPFAFANKAPLF